MRHIVVILFLISIGLEASGQNRLDQGIKYLEEGVYSEAQTTLAQFLKDNQNHKTANICYGRALGLEGKSTAAMFVFDQLDKLYPNDLEVLLNKAEAFMWSDDYQDALSLYTELYMLWPEDFTVLQGMAHANIALNRVAQAHIFIVKALLIDSEHQQAQISRKYIDLAYADELASQKKYNAAIKVLNSVLKFSNDDLEVLMAKANIYLKANKPQKAQSVFAKILKVVPEHYPALKGLSYTSLILGHHKQALDDALSINQIESRLSTEELKDYKIHLAPLFALNKDYAMTDSILSQLVELKVDPMICLQTETRVNLIKGNYQQASENIEVFRNESTDGTFQSYMTVVETERARGNLGEALKWLNKALELEPFNLDAMRLKEKLEEGRTVRIENILSTIIDNGNNESFQVNTYIALGKLKKFKPYLDIIHRRTRNGLGAESQSNEAQFGMRLQLADRAFLKGQLGIINAQDAQKQSFFVGRLSAEKFTKKGHYLGVDLIRTTHDYSTELIKASIGIQEIMVKSNLSLPFRMGLYAQVGYTHQTDSNTKTSGFVSLYKQLSEKLPIKLGLNSNYFSYSKQEELIYFAPKSFINNELFAEFNYRKEQKPFYVRVVFALGHQTIDGSQSMQSQRLEMEGGYSLKHVDIGVKYIRSNSGSATSLGYAMEGFNLQANLKF